GARRLLQSRPIPVVSEFWPYGLKRSGMTPERYSRIVSEVFTHFYCFSEKTERFEMHPIAEIGDLFHIYDKPRRGDQIVLINRA
ncbi:hypothetical protein OVW19_28590, partial [Klebsiella pneumoniae]|uniref:hypothetical protein n=1 Tax=Klebsiella pneumoniae TaxID=573 RepID=UPI00227109AF